MVLQRKYYLRKYFGILFMKFIKKRMVLQVKTRHSFSKPQARIIFLWKYDFINFLEMFLLKYIIPKNLKLIFLKTKEWHKINDFHIIPNFTTMIKHLKDNQLNYQRILSKDKGLINSIKKMSQPVYGHDFSI